MKTKKSSKLCTSCKYCVERDEGFSSYTVEGTLVYCLLYKNKDFPVDKFYNSEQSLEFAKECKYFKTGHPVIIEVETMKDDMPSLTKDKHIYKLLKYLVNKENIL